MGKSAEKAHNSVESSSSQPGIMARAKKLEKSSEYVDAAKDIASSAADTLGTVEPMGRVSEILGEAKENKGDGTSGGASDGDAKAKAVTTDPAELRKMLLKNPPSNKVMKKEIEKEIKKEIKYLHKRAMKMLRSPDVSYFEMNNVVSKIRDLKGILATLLKSSVDGLRTLWLRYVHGVM
jgi:hypothetical protein